MPLIGLALIAKPRPSTANGGIDVLWVSPLRLLSLDSKLYALSYTYGVNAVLFSKGLSCSLLNSDQG